MLPISTPLSVVDESFTDLGGPGDMPSQLLEGMKANGLDVIQGAPPQPHFAPEPSFAGLISSPKSLSPG